MLSKLLVLRLRTTIKYRDSISKGTFDFAGRADARGKGPRFDIKLVAQENPLEPLIDTNLKVTVASIMILKWLREAEKQAQLKILISTMLFQMLNIYRFQEIILMSLLLEQPSFFVNEIAMSEIKRGLPKGLCLCTVSHGQRKHRKKTRSLEASSKYNWVKIWTSVISNI